MYTLTKCPCCGEHQLFFHDAVIAPFIASYVLNQEPKLSRLAECKNCKLQFFIERFTDQEAEQLYHSYRQEEYFLERNKHEFWYTDKINNSTPEDVDMRKEIVNSFIRESGVDIGPIDKVLDYGGDQGQFFPSCFEQADKWLYDLSNYEPVPGVTKIKELSPGETPLFQWIMVCHLLEHLSEPQSLVRNICGSLETGGYLYIEVPEEQFHLITIPGFINRPYLKFLLKHKRAFQWIDIISLFFRLKLRIVPPFSFVKLHEHINFFSQQAIINILEQIQLNVICIKTTRIGKQDSGRSHIIQCIAQKQ